MSSLSCGYSTAKFDCFQKKLAKVHFLGTKPLNRGFQIKGGPKNGPNEEDDTCLILMCAVLKNLTVGDALIYFSEHREHVKKNPDADDHPNLRFLMSLPEKTPVVSIFIPLTAREAALQIEPV